MTDITDENRANRGAHGHGENISNVGSAPVEDPRLVESSGASLESPSFSSLGQLLAEIQRQAEADDGVMRTWFYNGMGQDKGEFMFDELRSIDRARKLLSADDYFAEQPEIVTQLRDAYEIAVANEVSYLRTTLAEQMMGLIRDVKARPLETLRRKERALVSRIEQAKEKIRRAVECAQIKTGLSIEITGVFIGSDGSMVTQEGVLEKPLDEILFGAGPGAAAENNDTKVIDELLGARRRIEDELVGIRAEIRGQEGINGILGRTQTKLAELGGPIIRGVILENRGVVSCPARGRNEEPQIRKPTKRQRVLTPGGSKTKTPEEGVGIESVPAPRDEVGESISRLQELIRTARRVNNRIRILLNTEQGARERYRRKWEKLLFEMGFNGGVITVSYEDLGRTGDIDTCVIIPRGMNTHGILWDRNKFTNAVVIEFAQPRALLSAVQSMREKGAPTSS